MSFCRTALICSLFYPISIFSQVEKKEPILSVEKLAFDKTYELIFENAQEAYEYGSAAIKEIEVPYDSVNYVSLLKVTGVAAQRLGKYENALNFHQKSANITKKLHLLESHAGCLANIANVFYFIDQYDNAIHYIKQSLVYYAQLDSVEDKIALRYNTLGVIYNEINQKDSAIHYYEKSLYLLDEDDLDRTYILDNLGALNEELGNYDLALEYHLSSKEIIEKDDDFEGLSWTLHHIGRVYTKLGRYGEAKIVLRKSMGIAKQLGLLNEQKDINESFFHNFLAEGQVDSASFYFTEYEALNDSINSERLNKNIQEIEAKYQVEKKEAALALSNEKTARLTAENNTNKLYLSGALVLLVLLTAGVFVLNRTYQQRRQINVMNLELKDKELKDMLAKQETESLSAMLKGQEEERERVAQDLHDRLGGTLVALKMAMRRPENKVEKEELEMLDGAVVELRNIAHNLSVGVMEKAGLKVALQELKQSIERSGVLEFNLFLSPDIIGIKQEVAIELYRIVQELTNNTMKHAQATEINLQTSMHDANFNLIFEDNGIGFSQGAIMEGMGMRNIKTRVEKINGQMHIDSQLGRGTIVIIEIEKA